MSCNRRSFETARAKINTCRVTAFCHAMRIYYIGDEAALFVHFVLPREKGKDQFYLQAS